MRKLCSVPNGEVRGCSVRILATSCGNMRDATSCAHIGNWEATSCAHTGGGEERFLPREVPAANEREATINEREGGAGGEE